MKTFLKDGRLIIDRQTFLETCKRESPNDENHRRVKEALKGGNEIFTTNGRGKVISKLIPKDGGWVEESLNE